METNRTHDLQTTRLDVHSLSVHLEGAGQPKLQWLVLRQQKLRKRTHRSPYNELLRADHDVFGCRILRVIQTDKSNVKNEVRKRCLRKCIEAEQNVDERCVFEPTSPKRLLFPLLHHDGDAHSLVCVNLRFSFLRVTKVQKRVHIHFERSFKSEGIVGFSSPAISFFVPRLSPLTSLFFSEARGCFLVRLIATSSSSSPVFTSFV